MIPSLHGRVFVPVENTADGIVNDQTRFEFKQDGYLFTATYKGGGIRAGHIIGHFRSSDMAQLRYHCLTDNNELKAGKARATFTFIGVDRMSIDMNWQWLEGMGESGRSHYEEIK